MRIRRDQLLSFWCFFECFLCFLVILGNPKPISYNRNSVSEQVPIKHYSLKVTQSIRTGLFIQKSSTFPISIPPCKTEPRSKTWGIQKFRRRSKSFMLEQWKLLQWNKIQNLCPLLLFPITNEPSSYTGYWKV